MSAPAPPIATSTPAPALTIGLARLMAHAYAGGDLRPLFADLLERTQRDPRDAGAMMDMATILQLTGARADGLALQADALRIERVYRRASQRADPLRVLALVLKGDLMANTPLDFLLDPAEIELTLLYVDDRGELPQSIPSHDVAMLAIGESPESHAALEGLAVSLSDWPRPLINGDPKKIAALTRDSVAARFGDTPEILAPPVQKLDRMALARASVAQDTPYPLIVRPLGSHAGEALEKLDDVVAVADYLQRRDAAAFYVAPFVDYSSPDGQFRKQRIVLVRGRPFVCHMAISSHWMVHYLSAGMVEDAAKRAEEARFMRTFEREFAARHARAFDQLYAVIGLDYFGIDCAETPDGRLLLFEVDVAMIVHALDDPAIFPYKREAMERMFLEFSSLVRSRA